MKTVTFSDLCRKEVICLCDGKRLGYIDDFEADLESGCLLAFFLPDGRGFFRKKNVYRVDRCWIERVGEDLILVNRYEKEQKCSGCS